MLDEIGWNVTEAAAKLDLARYHAYKLVRGFDLRRNADQTSANRSSSDCGVSDAGRSKGRSATPVISAAWA